MKRSIVIGCMTLALVGVGMVAGRVLATGVPVQIPLTYAGVVTGQDGKPLATAVDVTVAFYATPSGGSPKCQANVVQSEPGSGRFSVALPAACADAVHEHADLWSEATVGPTQVVLPRVHVGAVPYALEAEQAKQATQSAGPLKAALDGQQAKLDTLQAKVAAVEGKLDGLPGGGGGGGLFIYDAKGTKLGHFVDWGTYPWLMGGNNPQNSGLFGIATSKGYLVQIQPDGAFFSFNVKFLDIDCKGPARLTLANGQVLPNKFVVYASKTQQLYTLDGPEKGLSVASQGAYASSYGGQWGNCVNGTATPPFYIVPLKTVMPGDVGLPDAIVGPLYVAP